MLRVGKVGLRLVQLCTAEMPTGSRPDASGYGVIDLPLFGIA
jgi:hypothetical protein